MNQESTSQGSKKGVIAPWLLIVIIIVLLGGGGYIIWHYFGAKSSTTVTTTPAAPTSAKKVSPNPTAIPISTAPSTQNDTSLLINLCKTQNSQGITCEVEKIDGNFATGIASGIGGGAHWYAKKVNDEWAMIINGVQDDPPCSKTSDFPKTIVPTCGQY